MMALYWTNYYAYVYIQDIFSKHGSPWNIGSPQGCVLSAVLFILYTNGLIAKQNNCYIIKYADDTAIIGLISEDDEKDYVNEVKGVTDWCTDHNLLLNVKKTK